MESISSPCDNKQLKHDDLLQFLNVFSFEFNNSNLHDRVLVFQVVDEAGFPNSNDLQETLSASDNSNIKTKDDSAGAEQDDVVSMIENLASEKHLDKKEHEERDEGSKTKETIVVPSLPVKEDMDEESEKEIKEETGKAENVKVEVDKDEKPDEVNEEEKKQESSEQEKTTEDDVRYESDPIHIDNDTRGNWVEEIVVHHEAKEYEQLNEHKLFVHSCWLSVQSSYFKSLFYSGLKESLSKEVVMKISQSELQAHLTLIEAMYKVDIVDNKDYQLVVQVLILADKYDVQLVFKKCKYVLMDTPLTLESCEFILKNIVGVPNCDDLVECLKKFLVKEFSPLDKIWTEDKFVELSEASLKLLLSSDNLPVQSENTVFVALMRWIEDKGYFDSERFSSLLHLARYELMTVDFLYDVVRVHPTAKRMAGFINFFQQGLAYHSFSQKRRDLMENKPVKRPSVNDEEPTFLWIIDSDIRKRLFGFPGDIQSRTFWYKGYELCLSLEYNSMSNDSGFFLHVENIPEEGGLNLYWTAKSDLFSGNQQITMHHMYGLGKGMSWGRAEVLNDVSLKTVRKDVSHTIEVTVKLSNT